MFVSERARERGIEMKGACMNASEKATRAVRGCLCDKPVKYQTGGRVKQPILHYDRQKETAREREREKQTEAERGESWGQGTVFVLFFSLYFYLPDSFYHFLF